MQVAVKTSAVESLEAQLSESRKRFSGSCGDVSELEQRTRDLTLELSTLRAQYERLQHSVSLRIQQSVLSYVVHCTFHLSYGWRDDGLDLMLYLTCYYHYYQYILGFCLLAVFLFIT